jgi:hypothetical protein
MVTHMFVRLRTALTSWFALPEPTAEPDTSGLNANELWRYHASFYFTLAILH